MADTGFTDEEVTEQVNAVIEFLNDLMSIGELSLDTVAASPEEEESFRQLIETAVRNGLPSGPIEVGYSDGTTGVFDDTPEVHEGGRPIGLISPREFIQAINGSGGVVLLPEGTV